jgi:hypothetical protein
MRRYLDETKRQSGDIVYRFQKPDPKRLGGARCGGSIHWSEPGTDSAIRGHEHLGIMI